MSVVFADGLSLVIEPMRFQAPMAQLAADYAPDCPSRRSTTIFIGPVSERLNGSAGRRGRRKRCAAGTRKAYLAGMGPALQTALALADPLSLSVRAVQVTKAMPVWHSERIAFLGDAVHVMSPAGGLGANTALADAASLATHLAQAGSAAQALRTMVQICKRGARRRYAFHAWRPNGCSKTVTPATQRHDRHSIISTTSSQAFYRTPGPH